MKNLIKKILYISLTTLIFTTTNASSKLQRAPDDISYRGFYGGINLGFLAPNNRTLNTTANTLQYCTPAQGCTSGFINSQAAAAGATQSLSINKGNFIGGGGLGYNLVLDNYYLVGVETDIQGIASGNKSASLNNVYNYLSAPNLPQNMITTIDASKEISYLGTLRARLGYIWGRKLLFSGSGGLAYGTARSSVELSQNYGIPQNIANIATTWSSTGNYSKIRTGWVIGALGEYLFSKNWSAKLEYLHYDLGSINYVGTNSIDPIIIPNNPQVYFTNALSARAHFSGNIVRFGVNYHFG